ncbi:MAG: ATP cone domain-containing protein, partial [Longimicrobiales bacterium]
MRDTLVAVRTAEPASRSAGPPAAVSVRKRDGRTVEYDRSRIVHAVEMAFRAEVGAPYPDALDAAVHTQVERIAEGVESRLLANGVDVLEIESIQDEVERQLMAADEFAVARRYILYREARAARREGVRIRIREDDGHESILSGVVLQSAIASAAEGLGRPIDVEQVYRDTVAGLYEGVTRAEVSQAAILAARSRVEHAPEYSYLAARLLLDRVYTEALGRPVVRHEVATLYAARFSDYLTHGVACGRLDERLLRFDTDALASALRAERDGAFAFLGAQTLYDRYLL